VLAERLPALSYALVRCLGRRLAMRHVCSHSEQTRYAVSAVRSTTATECEPHDGQGGHGVDSVAAF